ncbi:MAG TPA: cation:proton antiporter [Jiangellales bacterium]|nr:cation:proton antiporter [Jiangellales bacterium]
MDRTAALLVELGAVFVGLSLLGALARRMRISPVPLFLLAGLAVGEGGVAPLHESQTFVEIGAELGVVLLLFALGLEFSAVEFTQSLRRHAPSGVVDLVLNATPGFVGGFLLGFGWTGALALAGVTWVSSSGIVARLLSDLGRLGFRESSSVLSVLVLEDIAMAAYLPALAVLLAGGSPVRAAAGSLAAVTVVLAVLWGSGRWGEHLARRFTVDDDEQLLLQVLGLTLLVAGLAQWLGASAAVGAFLVGLALSGRTADRAREVMRPLRDLFAAAFFLAFGLSTDTAAVLPALPAALALALVTGATKVGTGWYAARRDGVGPRGRLRAGTALVARGEFSVVVAGLAVIAGISGIGPLVSAYVLVLAVVGPLLARYADPVSDRFLTRRGGGGPLPGLP